LITRGEQNRQPFQQGFRFRTIVDFDPPDDDLHTVQYKFQCQYIDPEQRWSYDNPLEASPDSSQIEKEWCRIRRRTMLVSYQPCICLLSENGSALTL
jgi:hypothetical protein